jgi:exodeoxyribonuclease VII small subunit
MARKKQSFEQALRELEDVVAKLEDGALSLDESLGQYEQGIRLAEFCMRELDAARQRIEKLKHTKDGGMATEPLDEDEPADDPPATPGQG